MPVESLDEQFMRRAFRLAMNGRGKTEPNPSVGCVLVKGDRVIGEGHTQPFGGAHAEPTALANCTESPQGATAYVTLEPCCHTNKKTPPCAPKLIEAKLARVVYGCLDPNLDVNGKGVAMLRAAGITVDGPALEAEAKQLIAPFILRTLHNRPYVTLKWAETADGFLAASGGRPLRVTNERSTRIVHELRSRSDAITVGIGTVLADDPLLTSRGTANPRPLLRCVIDPKLRLPLDARIVRTAELSQVRVYASEHAYYRQTRKHEYPSDAVVELTKRGVRVYAMPEESPGILSRAEIISDQSRRSEPDRVGTHSLFETGPRLASLFLPHADRLWVFRGERRANGDDTAPRSPTVPSAFAETGRLGIDGDELTEYSNPASPAFFAAVPSADLVLARDAIS